LLCGKNRKEVGERAWQSTLEAKCHDSIHVFEVGAIIKIRTMRDGRVTRVGKVLRATGLDEIPQFINILSGAMSAVGLRRSTLALAGSPGRP
jgi:lipopolysaccharide/colanic/teichoic acid biosynthesis glycosyltransferase